MQNNGKAIKIYDIDGLVWMDTSPNQELATIFGNFFAEYWQFLPVPFIVSHSYFYVNLFNGYTSKKML